MSCKSPVISSAQKTTGVGFGVQDERSSWKHFKRRARKIEPKSQKRAGQAGDRSRGEKIDLTALPIPTYHEGDSGPYIACGILIAKSPSTGLRAWDCTACRSRKRKMGVHLSNPPIAAFAAEAEREGKLST
jgi:UbiD family decarboxylase